MKELKIFTGKQRDYNLRTLTLLYDNGPLSAWDLTAKMTDTGKQSLHSTLNKRLRGLEKKGYIRRENKKWILRPKGTIAILLTLEEPRMWNYKWKEVFESKAEIIEQNSEPLLKKFRITKENLHSMRNKIGLDLENFEAWVELSKIAKTLIENGIDFDVIKEETLFGLIVLEALTAEQLSDIWNQDIGSAQA